jgi:zinc/manganese transport system substrate-binding protein
MNRIFRVPVIVLLALVPLRANALEVFACEPEWGALATELGGERLDLTVATTAFQDPHRLEARPSLIAAIRRADLLVCTGAELEVGWLPLLLRRSGNPNVQVGAEGYFLAADYVRKLEVPIRIDRSQGDIHPQGNPHVHLNPHNIDRIAEALTERLVALDPAGSATYQARLGDFRARWTEATDRWESRGEPLAGLRLVSNHRAFSYLADWLDLQMVATLEPKPGIPPSSAHLAELLEQLTPSPPAAIVRTPYANEKPSRWLAERLGVPGFGLPYTVGGAEGVDDLFDLFEVTLTRLEEMAP